MKILLAVGTAALLWSATAFAADPVGAYNIEGANPGGGGNWTGIWTYAGGREVGPEIWKRQ